MKSVALRNLGCKVNGYEMDYIQQMLQENGYNIVPFDGLADIYIINTCTVTNIADRKSRQMIHRARHLNKDAVVVAVGCFVQAKVGEGLDADIDLAIGNDRKSELFSILEEFLIKREKEGKNLDKTLDGRSVIDIGSVHEYESMELYQTGGHARAYIKIQDGCNQFCSYCIIPYVRGRVRSRRVAEIIEEVSGLARKGYREVVLTGIHIGSYGVDWGEKNQLSELIVRLHDISELERIRLGSLEPRIITEEFSAMVAGLPKVCPHFHLSLQSGCDATLKRMNRHYTAAEYYDKMLMLRQAYERVDGNNELDNRDNEKGKINKNEQLPVFTTDVIVGFPGETEAEFEETYKYLERASFYQLHVFKYSKRLGTKAAEMTDQIPEAVKRERSERLLTLSKEMIHAYHNECIGSWSEIILEEVKEIGDQRYWLGHTKEYVCAAVKEVEERPYQVGEVLGGQITGHLNEEILLILPTSHEITAGDLNGFSP
ncbi:MAG: tRNA (N(6)-L-threonylcarbamoyladenosine(37)-C(2))-methylthiotransferase MtaB [Lachnospiraceae bacterium]|jgi:threonylcarbamoyladenosine tRNA methylthiotransferase MtaB|nr:tRNA (N(6)-L-threonylcarbamoyladenosine(37)-C(2))-methylthiotransferase MtaB [Lachnospiraceae bacterium]